METVGQGVVVLANRGYGHVVTSETKKVIVAVSSKPHTYFIIVLMLIMCS